MAPLRASTLKLPIPSFFAIHSEIPHHPFWQNRLFSDFYGKAVIFFDFPLDFVQTDGILENIQ